MILPGWLSWNAEALGGLAGGQIGQHAAGQARVEPQHLPGGEDAVAAERGREPGDAGERIGAGRQVGDQEAEVGARLLEPGGVANRPSSAAARRAARACGWCGARRPAPGGSARCDGCSPSPGPASTKRSIRSPGASVNMNSARLSSIRQGGSEKASVAGAQRHRPGPRRRTARGGPSSCGGSERAALGRGARRAPRTCRGSRRRILEHQRQHHLVEAEVGAADALVEPLVRQRPPPLDVDRAARRAAAVHRRQRAVGAVEGEDGVVPGERARQPGRMAVADQEHQAAKARGCRGRTGRRRRR